LFYYSPKFELRWPEHVFPIEKYRLLAEAVVEEGLARADEVVEPAPATDGDLLLVHTPEYLRTLEDLAEQGSDGFNRYEAPFDQGIWEALRYAAGGTMAAARSALAGAGGRHWAFSVAGGYHHAYPDHGEGFCFINDVAMAARAVQRDGLADRVFVVDCDLHQGNGTAAAFRGDERVFTFSIHQENLYPAKERGDCDIGLADFAGDSIYLDELRRALPGCLDEHGPELGIYLAGADPYAGDRLGSLSLSKRGLEERDRFVFEELARRAIPVAVTTAGGYAERTLDVVDIHLATVRAVMEVCGPVGGGE